MFSKPYALNAGNKRVGLDERSVHYSAESLHLGGRAGQGARVRPHSLQEKGWTLVPCCFLTASMQRMTVFLELIPLFYWET